MSKETIIEALFVIDGEDLEIASPMAENFDGSYSFEVANDDNSVRYKHTIKTEEI